MVLLRCPLNQKFKLIYEEQFHLKKELAGIPFLDFKNFFLFEDEFLDLDHLNYKGVNEFSRFFNQLIKDGLLEVDNKQDFINRQMESRKKSRLSSMS